MLIRTVTMLLLLTGAASAANTGRDAFSTLVKGKTTVADVEQTLGAPLDTATADDGALTLTYPAQRMSARLPRNGQVALSFAPISFTLQASTVTIRGMGEAGGLAAK